VDYTGTVTVAWAIRAEPSDVHVGRYKLITVCRKEEIAMIPIGRTIRIGAAAAVFGMGLFSKA
jgi:hypothetical protein